MLNPDPRVNSIQSRESPRRTVMLLGGLAVVVASQCIALLSPRSDQASSAAEDVQTVARSALSFDNDGALRRPENYREWVFIGAPVTPNEMNGGKAAFPEFHNVYIDPKSFSSYKQTGAFPEGTVIVKELVSVGGKAMPSGKGYFQGDFVSLEAMVKDSRRFREEPGGWVFFRFGEAPNYKPVGARMKTESCNSCHSTSDEDYVFTSTYPVLRAAKPKTASR